ncbi:MAG: lpd [Nitrospirae bacterium]|nr:lpd [Nitrospirota bacterium]
MKLAILGSGPGGYVAAIRAAQLGARVTIIEENEVGGTCLNWGCIPTKSLVASSEMFSKAKRLQDFGIETTGNISPNFLKILERKNRIVNLQIKGIRNLFKLHGITLQEGRGQVVSPTEIIVESKNGAQKTVTADRIIVATGSKTLQLPAFPFDGRQILSTDDVFRLDAIPKSLTIIGAGVSGCEFACIFRQLGSEVTLLEKLPRALATEDTEISHIFERELKKHGIRFIPSITVDKIDMRDGGVHIFLGDGTELGAEKALVSVGRSFNSDGIGLEKVGIRKGTRGEIIANEKMETNIPGIYAVGDVTGGHMLAHVASAEGIVAANNSVGGNERADYSAVPSAIFTSPEIASVGITEQQAVETGIKVRTGHFQFRTLAKSHIMGEIEGMIKIVSDESSDKILGVHMIGPHASDLIHEGVLAISKGLKTKDISNSMHAHPTLSEVLQEAAADVHGEAIHGQKK